MMHEAERPLRVIQWSTGNAGRKALRGILAHPGLKLVGVHSNRDGAGAKVRLGKQWAYATTSGSYLSASDRRLIFGLGSSTAVDRVTVQWPGGGTEYWNGLAVDGAGDSRGVLLVQQAPDAPVVLGAGPGEHGAAAAGLCKGAQQANSRLRQTIRDGMGGKTRIMLAAGKALLLSRGDDFTAVEQRSRAVVIIGGNSKNLH